MSDIDSEDEGTMDTDIPDQSEYSYSADLRFPFSNSREAEITYNTLRVDKEPPRGGCRREISLNGSVIEVKFTAQEAKKLKKGLNAFMDSFLLVKETIEKFGPPVVEQLT